MAFEEKAELKKCRNCKLEVNKFKNVSKTTKKNSKWSWEKWQMK